MVIGELIDERKLSKIEEKLCNNGLIDSDPYSYKGFNIIGNRIIHRTQIDHYFNLSKDIHIDYAKKDFYKDFNIKPIDSQKMIIPAIKMNINHDNSESYDVYNFTCKATELIKFASVARRTPVKEELSSYQRLISSKRISDIGKKFITEQKGFFPNNIVIKLEKDKISFSKSTLSDESFKGFDSEIGILEITEDYNTAWIIDGQHRLFSFFKADTNEDINDLVNVAAIVGVPPQKEVEYFIDINDKSKSVPKDLIWDLTGKIDPLSKDGIISNVCKELFSIDKTFSERQLNPFYRKLTIPSLTDKGGRNFSALCSLLKYECVGGDITREKYTKKMGDRVLTDVKNPYLGTTLETFSKNIANAFSAFFHEFGKNLHPLKTKTFYRNNNSLFILVLVADRYFRYHNRMKIVKDDRFFKILASFINDLTNEQISAYKNASNAEKRREIIGDIVYHMQMNYKENFFNIVQSQFIVDVHYFCETKFPKFVYKKIKKEFGVDFVFNCPALKSISIDYINKKNRRGTNAEAWQNLNFYSDLIKNFILNNNALKLDKDKSEEFKSMLNQNGTINVWDNCFEDIFTNKKMSLGFLSRKDFENAILRVKDYFDATRHTERKSHQVKDNYNPTVRAGIKADFEHLDKIITLELDKL